MPVQIIEGIMLDHLSDTHSALLDSNSELTQVMDQVKASLHCRRYHWLLLTSEMCQDLERRVTYNRAVLSGMDAERASYYIQARENDKEANELVVRAEADQKATQKVEVLLKDARKRLQAARLVLRGQLSTSSTS